MTICFFLIQNEATQAQFVLIAGHWCTTWEEYYTICVLLWVENTSWFLHNWLKKIDWMFSFCHCYVCCHLLLVCLLDCSLAWFWISSGAQSPWFALILALLTFWLEILAQSRHLQLALEFGQFEAFACSDHWLSVCLELIHLQIFGPDSIVLSWVGSLGWLALQPPSSLISERIAFNNGTDADIIER